MLYTIEIVLMFYQYFKMYSMIYFDILRINTKKIAFLCPKFKFDIVKLQSLLERKKKDDEWKMIIK